MTWMNYADHIYEPDERVPKPEPYGARGAPLT
ncbi:Uncharacterised protein [Rhodococcus erythropolis]|nr:Uncharacterised protein [Rhodococcus erythropolis]